MSERLTDRRFAELVYGDPRLVSLSPIARVLAALDAGLGCDQTWRKVGGGMTLREWSQLWESAVSMRSRTA